ncbi:antibiotic biosynthesis monooxygenase [Flavobacteriales bacterium]|nr:antibiotic biosynthesis monooxygenase [Flavobacteriales bacterium]
MIIRIVKLTISPDKVTDFKSIYESHMELIKGFEGCEKLELLQEKGRYSNVVMTYSYWNSEEDLAAYRDSDLFLKVWKTVKPLFCAKPEAWSMERKFEL